MHMDDGRPGGGSRQTFGNHLADCHGDAGLAFTSPRAVERGLGRIIEYYGPRLESLSAMDRHLIANMGAPGSIYRHRRSCPHHFGENSGCLARALEDVLSPWIG